MKMMMLPPHPKSCQICAVKHDETHPHNAQSLYYQVWFAATYGRAVTWNDALMHCPDHIKAIWMENFEKCGIDANSPNLTGDIKSTAEVEKRLQGG